MKRLSAILPFILALSASCVAGTRANKPEITRFVENYNHSSVQFEANLGQAPANVDFIARGLQHSLALNATGAVLGGGSEQSTEAVRIQLLGSDRSARPEGIGSLPVDIGYLIGNDRSKWLRHVPAFAKIKYAQIWPGIDVVYYGTQSRLEYDFIVHPGADAGLIRLGFTGMQSLALSPSGDLILGTAAGDMTQRTPRVYQRTGTVLSEIASRYVLEGEHNVRFEVGQYDRTSELVIDPVVVYAKILNAVFTSGNAVTLTPSGNAYYAGQAFIQVTPTAAQFVAFIVILDSLGNQLAYITVGGTNGQTTANSIAVDNSGNIYLTGATAASDFPDLGLGFQTSLADTPGNLTDAYLIKLSPTFSVLYSTYLGGHGNDVGNAVVADGAGQAYVAGQTAAADFAKTIGPAFRSSTTTGFVAKINTTIPSGPTSKIWTTLTGGSGTDMDNAILVDGAGNITVAGTTTSADFLPSSTVGYSTTKTNGANSDGFVLRLDATGANALYFTYWPFGRIGAMAGSGTTVYTTGQTNGNIFTTSSNAYQVSGGANHAFLTKLNTAVGGVNSVLYSSYLLGSGTDAGLGVATDGSGNGYIVGTTTSTVFPITPGGIGPPSPSAVPDAFYTVLSTTSGPGIAGLVFSTVLGGNANDTANAIAVDAAGNAVITGNTASNNFISSIGSGVFGLKFSGLGVNQTPVPSSLSPVASTSANQTFTFQFSDLDGYQDLDVVNVLINNFLDGRFACYVGYSRPSNVLYLVDDSTGALLPGLPLNGVGSVSNSQCTINGSGSSASGSGTLLNLTLNITFNASFGGNKVIYMAARDSVLNNSGWYTMGVHGVPPLPSVFPQSISMNPSSGSTSASQLTFTYQDQTNANNLQTTWALMNTALDGRGACYIAYYRPGNLLLLLPDNGDGSQASSMVLNGANTSVSNSQCTIFGQGSSASVNGAQLSVTVKAQFNPSFGGRKAVWLADQTLSLQTGNWQALGAWLVPSI